MFDNTIFFGFAFGQYFIYTFANTEVVPSPVPYLKSNFNLLENITRPICTTKDFDDTRTRNGLTNKDTRWKNFFVLIDPDYSFKEHKLIWNAMLELEKVIPCVRFGNYQPSDRPVGDYIYVQKGTNNGCNSAVGRKGGRQIINLQSPYCMNKGVILHEMLHALGFYHEHSREDRNDHVTIHWENIKDGLQFAFYKYDGPQYSSFGVPYNPRSIMHYYTHDFSKNGKPTLTAKNGGPVGSESKLQATDKQKLRNMYKCWM